MSIFRGIKNLLGVNGDFEKLSLGEVVDTNDPQQMGRIRAACSYLGDHEDTIIEDIPWATPISPLAGITDTPARGRGTAQSYGPVAYGMFNTPKVGAYVLLACIEGDPRFRVYLGGMHEQFLLHTLPHGRYTYQKNRKLQGEPEGPLTSTENFLQPLYDSLTMAFTKKQEQQVTNPNFKPPTTRRNYEYKTRGADHSVAGIDNKFINTDDVFFSTWPDDKELSLKERDGNVIESTQGYHRSRVQRGLESSATKFAYDPQVYSWTTPGFHSVSMDDSADNCRIRVRSTHGHQIIMDDTNERIYISTSQGKTWIEMDEKGNIDIYGERNISVHAEKDINFTAGDTFRVKAKNGIHMISEDEIRIHAKGQGQTNSEGNAELGSLHIKSDTDIKVYANNEIFVESVLSQHFNSFTDIRMYAEDDFQAISNTGTLFLSSDLDLNIKAGGNILNTATQIHFNGPSAAYPADLAKPSEYKEAWWTNRIPEHEPWARVMTFRDHIVNPTAAGVTDADGKDTGLWSNKNSENTHIEAEEYLYNDQNVGRIERGFDLNRNLRWHR